MTNHRGVKPGTVRGPYRVGIRPPKIQVSLRLDRELWRKFVGSRRGTITAAVEAALKAAVR